jgi:hypothetical protein
MKFIISNLSNIILTIIWIVAGINVLLSDTVSKTAYAVLLICFIATSISNMVFKYYSMKKEDD